MNVSFDHFKKNEVYLQIKAEPHIYYELRDAFQFEVPNARYSPHTEINGGMGEFICSM